MPWGSFKLVAIGYISCPLFPFPRRTLSPRCALRSSLGVRLTLMARVELHRAQEALEAEHKRSLSEPSAVYNERRRWLGMQFHQRVLEAADEALRSAAARGDMKELRELLASDGWLASDESRLAGSAQLRQLRLADASMQRRRKRLAKVDSNRPMSTSQRQPREDCSR